MKYNRNISANITTGYHKSSFTCFLFYYFLFFCILTVLRWTGIFSKLPVNIFAASVYFRGDFNLLGLVIELGYCSSLLFMINNKKLGFWLILLFAVLDIIIKGLILNSFTLIVAFTPILFVLVLFIILRLTGDWGHLN